MGSLSIYLLPEGLLHDPDAYRQRIIETLLAMGVISDANYGGQPTWYLAGPDSRSPFSDPGAQERGFDYCIVNASSEVAVVPQDPAVEPCCPSCSSSLSDEYYSLVEAVETGYHGAARSIQYLQSRIPCPSCSRTWALPELKDRVGVFLSGTWVNFEDAPSGVSEEWLALFVAATGLEHRALEYWYT